MAFYYDRRHRLHYCGTVDAAVIPWLNRPRSGATLPTGTVDLDLGSIAHGSLLVFNGLPYGILRFNTDVLGPHTLHIHTSRLLCSLAKFIY